TGDRRDPDPVPSGAGFDLPLHHTVREAPGWLGLVFTLIADGTFFVSLLFGYVYLYLIAPGAPPSPELQVEPDLLATGAAILALIVGAATARLARRANARGRGGAGTWSWACTAAGVIASLLVTVAAVVQLPSPQSHAHNAIAAFCIGWLLVHTSVAVVLAAFAAARVRAGFVSARRSLDLRLMSLWWDFTAVTGLVLMAMLFLLP